MPYPSLYLKKQEERRLAAGHLWVYSNEVDTQKTPINHFDPGQLVTVVNYREQPMGVGYVNPRSLITARLLDRNPQTKIDADFLYHRLEEALLLRTRLFAKPYYRLVFAESDGLAGIIIDRFNRDLVVQINTAGMQALQSSLITALERLLKPNSILLKNDSSIRLQEGLTTELTAGMGAPPDEAMVDENDITFFFPLWHGQKTGWFYDHRFNRGRLKPYVTGQRVLDVFSYLGAWGLHAAHYGAKEVCCIDASELACQYILKNATHNRVAEKVSVICEDAFTALKKLDTHQAFDIIILDPPAFIKKQKDLKAGLIAYRRLNELALRLLTPGGILFTASCSMHLDETTFIDLIRRAGIDAKTQLQLLERGHQAPDHPLHLAIRETEYLKLLIIRKIN